MHCYFGLEKLKKEDNVGHYENASYSYVTENKMLVSTRTTDDITIHYLKCIRRVAIKATICFVVSACQFARPHETTRLPVGKFCVILYWVILLQFCRENSNWVNIGQKYQALTCDILFLLGKKPLCKNIARIFGQDLTVTSKGLLLHRVRMQRLSPVVTPPYVSLRLICRNSRQATVLSPLKWKTVTFLSPRSVTSVRSSIHNRTFHLGKHGSRNNGHERESQQ